MNCEWQTNKAPIRLGRIGVEQKTVPMLELKTPNRKVPYCKLLAVNNQHAQCTFYSDQLACPYFSPVEKQE